MSKRQQDHEIMSMRTRETREGPSGGWSRPAVPRPVFIDDFEHSTRTLGRPSRVPNRKAGSDSAWRESNSDLGEVTERQLVSREFSLKQWRVPGNREVEWWNWRW